LFIYSLSYSLFLHHSLSNRTMCVCVQWLCFLCSVFVLCWTCTSGAGATVSVFCSCLNALSFYACYNSLLLLYTFTVRHVKHELTVFVWMFCLFMQHWFKTALSYVTFTCRPRDARSREACERERDDVWEAC
jgi:hypothetical protein